MKSKCVACGLDENSGYKILDTANGSHCIFHQEAVKPSPEVSIDVGTEDITSLIDSITKQDVQVPVALTGSSISPIDISKAKFLAGLRIHNLCARHNISILASHVDGETQIFDCAFQGNFHLEENTFAGHFYFHDNIVSGDMHLSESSFQGVAIISTCEFQRYLSFRKGVFHEYFWSTANSFLGYVSGVKAQFKREAFFEGCAFTRVTTFDQITFSRTASFRSSTFLHAPTFFETSFGEALGIVNSVFRDLTSQDAYQSYRLIRERFAAQEMRRAESFFYNLEQCAITRTLPLGFERTLARAYEFISDYGTSLRKPLLSLLSIQAFCFLIYLAASYGDGIALDYTFTQLFNPFSSWGGESRFSGTSLDRLSIKLVSSMQAIGGIACLTLAFFALRWRFKTY